MITHGSQIITDLRRGTWRITSMTRGTFDILSPYCWQATVALKAAFPTQWETIRDYGFAHPALVPFINEDPMLVMSLIEGLGTRWLKSDGYCAVLIEGFKPNQDSHVIAEYMHHSLPANLAAGQNVFGAADGWKNKSFETMLPVNSADGCLFVYNNATSLFTYSIPQDTPLLVDANKNVWTYRNLATNTDITVRTFTYANFQTSYDLGVFTLNRGTLENIDKGKMSLRYIRSANGEFNAVPCFHKINDVLVGGLLDVIDLEHPKFYPNLGTGSFTISETPSS